MTNIRNPAFIDYLKAHHPLFAETLGDLLKKGKDHYQILMYCVRNNTPLPGQKACSVWADALGVALIDLNTTLFQPQTVMKIPREFAQTNGVIPVYQMGDAVTVAMADPLNYDMVQETSRVLGEKISPVFALRDDILDAIDVQHHSTDEIDGITDGIDLELFSFRQEIAKADLEKQAENKAIVDLNDALLLMAIKENASDIHIEPQEDHTLIRYRIDGVLQEKLRLAIELHLPLVSRLKILAGMDITERRRPQDGRVGLSLKTKTIGFRMSAVPTVNGEKIVLRVLGQAQKKNIPQLEELHCSKKIYTWCKQIIHAPSGAILITGPTGSGKTTTLFSALQDINSPGKNIMTIEDPVEYRLAGISQVQVDHSIGLGFAELLRSFLRQDPDIMLIGEIRDLETAKIATEAALTGHLVFATLHTNNAIQAVTRLVEIGVQPYMVGPSILGIMAQRLARRLCERCREKYTLSREKMDELFEWEGLEPLTLYKAKGCPECSYTGYKGRIAIHEMLLIDERMRKLIIANAPIEELYNAATAAGYNPMHYDGIKKVIRGLTSLEEIERVLPMF